MLRFDQLQDARDVWVSDRLKIIPEDTLYMLTIDDLYHTRKLRRTRENSKSGSASLDFVSMGKAKKNFRKQRPDEYVNGQDKWDDLIESMTNQGWLDTHPALIMMSNRRGKPKMRDGHHRLGVAMSLGMETCPIQVCYVWKEDD